jgi:hypothetical protein
LQGDVGKVPVEHGKVAVSAGLPVGDGGAILGEFVPIVDPVRHRSSEECVAAVPRSKLEPPKREAVARRQRSHDEKDAEGQGRPSSPSSRLSRANESEDERRGRQCRGLAQGAGAKGEACHEGPPHPRLDEGCARGDEQGRDQEG